MKRGVIFDMDGVLVASGPAHAASWRLVAEKHGVRFTSSDFDATFGQTSRDIIRRYWGEVTDADAARIDHEKEQAYRDLITGIVPLTIGVREALSGLRRAGFVLAVGTSGPPQNLDLVLRETGLGEYFTATVHGHEVPRGKPAPDIFATAAERCGLDPGRSVVVEDAPVGIEAALAAGMKVVGMTGTHPAERLRAAGAHEVIERISHLTPVFIERVLGSA